MERIIRIWAFFLTGLMLLCMLIMSSSSESAALIMEKIDSLRMKNVVLAEPFPSAAPSAPPSIIPSAPLISEPADESPSPPPAETPLPVLGREEIQETTISGGLTIKNETDYPIDIPALLSAGTDIALSPGAPQVLIIHTHSSEAYTPAGLDRYEASDTHRTEDKEYNIIRIGDELASIYQEAGLNVIHDRGIYDSPSYTGSYTRSGAAIEEYLSRYPEIAIVIDMHRDALGANGIVYKTMAEEDGVCASQLMLLVGSDESGLEHPHWRSNLSLALYMQNAVNTAYPTLMRPVSLVPQRYNQHLTRGSLILEVGSDGNTLQEALAAIRLFGKSTAPALKELVVEMREEAV